MTARYLLTVTDESATYLEAWLEYGLKICPMGYHPGAVTVAGLDAVTDEEYEFIARRMSSSGYYERAGASSGRPEDARTACDHVFFSGDAENQPPGTGELCLAGCRTARYTWADGTVTFSYGAEAPA